MADRSALTTKAPIDADALKILFKKGCAETDNVYQNWQIRLHRAISWLKRASQFGEDQPEARFLFLWIALNSLYSRWSAVKNAPDIDSHARNDFIRVICAMDSQSVGRTNQTGARQRHRR